MRKISARLTRIACLSTVLLSAAAHAEDVVFWSEFEPAGCPPGRITVSDLLYYSAQNWPIARDVDLTEWDNLFGRALPGGPVTPWPGEFVSVAIEDFDRDGYVAAHFTVPDGAAYAGLINHATYLAGAELVGAISRWCGDFRHTEPRCVREAGAGEALSRWRSSLTSGQCQLEAGEYYFNIKLRDPDQQAPGCGSQTCEENLQNTWSLF